jgi:hypothetical protein
MILFIKAAKRLYLMRTSNVSSGCQNDPKTSGRQALVLAQMDLKDWVLSSNLFYLF